MTIARTLSSYVDHTVRNLRKAYLARSLAMVTLAALAVVGVGFGGSAANAAPASVPTPDPGRIELQLLGINEFHGRLEAAPQQNIAASLIALGVVVFVIASRRKIGGR